jgi:carbon monoxide dehydrogenase subunit G
MAMEMDHSFTVPVPPDQAWDVLLDVERIAPCMPGATVDEVDGDVVNGRIKVKVGPVSLTYKGTAKFTERNSDAHVVVLEASGKETRGAGTASANVRASMVPDASGSGTEVTMHTTMNVTGRPAQFGRGVMVEVGSKLVEQFAQNLSKLIAGGSDGSGSDDSGSAGAGSAGAGSAGAGSAGAGSAGAGSAGAGSGAAADAAPAADASPASSGGSVDGASVVAPGAVNGTVNHAAPAAAATTTAPPPAPAAATTTATAPAPAAATTTAPAPAAASDDSINLIKLVGPPILKRAVPALLAAAGVTLLGRLIWRLMRQGKQD